MFKKKKKDLRRGENAECAPPIDTPRAQGLRLHPQGPSWATTGGWGRDFYTTSFQAAGCPGKPAEPEGRNLVEILF